MAIATDLERTWQESFAVRRVFGDPVEKDGTTVIPVAKVAGGGGGGEGKAGEHDKAEGTGGGFGGIARPAGVYVMRPEGVKWVPAVDRRSLVLAGIAIAGIVAMRIARSLR